MTSIGGVISAFLKAADPIISYEIKKINSDTNYIIKKLDIKPDNVKQNMSLSTPPSEINYPKDAVIADEKTPIITPVISFSI